MREARSKRIGGITTHDRYRPATRPGCQDGGKSDGSHPGNKNARQRINPEPFVESRTLNQRRLVDSLFRDRHRFGQDCHVGR